jgi:hypothetical protein
MIRSEAAMLPHIPIYIVLIVIALRVLWLVPDWGQKILALLKAIRRHREP